MYDNDNNSAPQWISDIREGRFNDASERLLQAAEARVMQRQLAQEAADITEEAGSAGKLYAQEAGAKVDQRFAAGEFRNQQQVLQSEQEGDRKRLSVRDIPRVTQ